MSGSTAERLNLASYFVYNPILTGLAYPFVSRWCWFGGGWLKAMGFRDFGGSGIVHLFSGTCAVVAAWIIGPRSGRFSSPSSSFSRHSLPVRFIKMIFKRTARMFNFSFQLLGLGFLLLLMGFMGFNAASQLSLSQPGDGPIIVLSAFNTLLAASGGALAVLLAVRFLPSKDGQQYWSYVGMVNGALAGGVAVCAGCGFMAPWAAVVTGILAGLVFLPAQSLMEKLESKISLKTLWPAVNFFHFL